MRKIYKPFLMEENQGDKGAENVVKPKGPMWQCPVCGTRVWVSNRRRHLRTRKHLDAQYVMQEKFEINI